MAPRASAPNGSLNPRGALLASRTLLCAGPPEMPFAFEIGSVGLARRGIGSVGPCCPRSCTENPANIIYLVEQPALSCQLNYRFNNAMIGANSYVERCVIETPSF
jgi:hypothetical protein